MKKLPKLEIDYFICSKYFFHFFGVNSDANLGVGQDDYDDDNDDDDDDDNDDKNPKWP